MDAALRTTTDLLISAPISGNDRVQPDSSGSTRSSAAVRADGPAVRHRVRREGAGEPGRLPASQPASIRPVPEQLVDLPHQRPGPRQVGQLEVRAEELDADTGRWRAPRRSAGAAAAGRHEGPPRPVDVVPVQGHAEPAGRRPAARRSCPRSQPRAAPARPARPGPGPHPSHPGLAPATIVRTRPSRGPGARPHPSALTACSRYASPPPGSPPTTRAIPCRYKAAGVAMPAAASVRAALLASGARICRTPWRHCLCPQDSGPCAGGLVPAASVPAAWVPAASVPAGWAGPDRRGQDRPRTGPSFGLGRPSRFQGQERRP